MSIIKRSEVKPSPETMRKKIVEFEERFKAHPRAVSGKELDKMCPLKHKFVDGAYVREIFMPKGTLLTSKIHKICHPYFVMEGDCSVLTDNEVVRIKAPYNGITTPWTKRVLYMHEDTVWITVHVTKHKNVEKIEEEIIAKSFDEMEIKEEHIDKLKNAQYKEVGS